MGETLTIYQREILPRLDLARLLSDLGARTVGDNVYVRCPQCGKPDAFIKKGWDTIGCNRENSCGAHINLLAHLNNGTMPDRKAWVDMVRELGKGVGVTIPEKQWTPEQVAVFEKRKHEENVLARVYAVCHERLTQDMAAVAYLHSRGFKTERISSLEFGSFNRQAVMDCCTPEELEPLGLKKEHWDNRLLFPLKDAYGTIRGLAARDLTGKADPKYIKTLGFEPDDLILEGLDQARRYKRIIAGESSMAIHTFRENDHPEMTGAGGSYINAKRWQALYDLGVEAVTIAFDHDKAGLEGTVKSCQQAVEAANAPDIYVIDPKFWGEHNDPDAFLREVGIEATNLILSQAVSMNTYLAKAYAALYDISTDQGRHLYFDIAAKYLASIKDERKALVAWEDFFKRGFQPLTGVTEDFFFDFVCRKREQEEEKKLKDRLTDAQMVIRDASNNGDIAKARDEISKIAQELRTTDQRTRPLLLSSARLEAHTKHLAETSGKDYLGIPQHVLPTLDSYTLGMRDLIGIAAGPGIGKTSLAIQMATDAVTRNPDVCLLIISLEMPEEELLTRMKSRAIGVSYDQLRLASTPEMRLKANESIRSIADRMFIIDKEICPEIDAETAISKGNQLLEITGCKRIIIVIDYFQRWPVPNYIRQTFRGDQDIDDWRTKQMERISDAFAPNPTIVISEINKMNQFKAAGMASAKGSAGFPYACDSFITLNEIEEEDLLERIELVMDSFRLKQRYSRYKRKTKEKISDEDACKALDLFLRTAEQQGKVFLDLSLDKCRGGRKGRFVLSNKHILSDMKELAEHGEAAPRVSA